MRYWFAFPMIGACATFASGNTQASTVTASVMFRLSDDAAESTPPEPRYWIALPVWPLLIHDRPEPGTVRALPLLLRSATLVPVPSSKWNSARVLPLGTAPVAIFARVIAPSAIFAVVT